MKKKKCCQKRKEMQTLESLQAETLGFLNNHRLIKVTPSFPPLFVMN